MAEVVGMPAEFVAQAKTSPWWPAQEAIAHTLAYDATVMDDYSIPVEAVKAIHQPTRVLTGSVAWPWMASSNQALAALLEDGSHEVLAEQQHNVDPAVLAPALKEFLVMNTVVSKDRNDASRTDRDGEPSGGRSQPR